MRSGSVSRSELGIVTVVILFLLFAWSAVPALARPATPAPPLPPPTGSVVRVSTEPQLQAAVASVKSDTTIVIAPGHYTLTHTVTFNRALSNVTLRGATDNRDDVVLVGRGMTNQDYGDVPFGVWTGNGVTRITIANLTIRDMYFHTIIFNAGTQSPHVYNVHLVDSGQQFIKSNPDNAGGGVNNGILEYSVIEFTKTARDDYPKGIDIHTGANWIIRHNLFRNIVAPGGKMAGPGVLAWNHSSNTTVEGNTFLNCSRGIMFGANVKPGHDHTGGIVRNNFIFRSISQPGDVGIHVCDSPNTQVLNNTVILSGTYSSPIEYRYPGTEGGLIANNLVDGEIRARNGGTATLNGNVTNATEGMFVNPSAGDLHLKSSATGAIDRGVSLPSVVDDWDGDPRPKERPLDVGADQHVTQTPARR